MQLNFTKVETGQSLNFAKDFGDKIEGVVSFNLNWGTDNGQAVDLDSILVMERRTKVAIPSEPKLGFWGKTAKFFGLSSAPEEIAPQRSLTEVIYFGNRRTKGVVHHGDDRTGAFSEGEFIEIDLNQLDPSINVLTFSVLSFSGHSFGKLPFAEMKVFTGKPNQPKKGLVHHSLKEFKNSTMTVVLAQMKKIDNEWIMTAHAIESQSKSVDASPRLARAL